MSKIMTVSSGLDWTSLSDEWEQSGLSQKKFCERHGISYHIFRRHRGIVRKRESKSVKLHTDKTNGSSFLPVTVEIDEADTRPIHSNVERSVSDAPSAEVEVELPFGVVLRFRGVTTL